MQIVPLGNNLHEMPKAYFLILKKKEETFQDVFAEHFTQIAKR